jgi:hypothetical protein
MPHRASTVPNTLVQATIFKKCDRTYHKPGSNKGCAGTISRAISAITPLLVQALLDYVPTADELDVRTCYIVDGTLLPCWS